MQNSRVYSVLYQIAALLTIVGAGHAEHAIGPQDVARPDCGTMVNQFLSAAEQQLNPVRLQP
jgi:hypothetical protein